MTSQDPQQPDPSTPRRIPRLVWLALVLVALLAGAVRATHLEAREMGHLEIFVPGIDLPESSLGPPPRTTLSSALTGSLWEPHPPAWYLGMLLWTRTFGQELAALRMESVLAGALGVLLLGWLATLEGGWLCGLLAAALLALHGHHVFWSQVARPYVSVGTLAIAATTCLVLATRARRRPGGWLAAYLVLTAVGLASLYYYWIVLGAHVLWVLLSDLAERRGVSRLLRWQVLVLLAASPLVTLAIFQSRRSILDDDALAVGWQLLQLGFLFETDYGRPALLGTWQAAGLALAGVLLVGAGLGRSAPRPATERHDTPVGPPPLALGIAAVLATATSLGAAQVLARYRPERLETMRWTAVVPLALLAALWAWGRLAPRAAALAGALGLRRAPAPTTVLALAPWPVVAAISLFIPFFATRNLLIFTPFLLALVARGAVALASARHGRVSGVRLGVLGAALLVVCSASTRAGLRRPGTVAGYRQIAEQWRPRIEPEDRIVVQEHFYSSPIFYYLRDHRARLVERDLAGSLESAPGARVWLFRFERRPLSDELVEALSGRAVETTLEVENLRVDLYVPAAADGSPR